MWRQGDIFMAAVDRIPEQAERLAHGVLAEGEITGHAHRIADPRLAELYEHGGQLYLRVVGEQAAIVHDEHHGIVLHKGHYRVWRQREFRPPVETRQPQALPQGTYVDVQD
jgi:hypothetical protein